MNQLSTSVNQAVSRFVRSCGRDYEFPAGGRIGLLTHSEIELLNVLKGSEMSDAEKVSAMSNGLSWSDCYSVVIFGIRLAVLGVRTGSRDTFGCGVLALAA